MIVQRQSDELPLQGLGGRTSRSDEGFVQLVSQKRIG